MRQSVIEYIGRCRVFLKQPLVAEPRLLGELRGALDKPTAALVSASLDKDLAGIDNRDIPKHLGKLVQL
jgi:protein required for attachment to host cells